MGGMGGGSAPASFVHPPVSQPFEQHQPGGQAYGRQPPPPSAQQQQQQQQRTVLTATSSGLSLSKDDRPITVSAALHSSHPVRRVELDIGLDTSSLTAASSSSATSYVTRWGHSSHPYSPQQLHHHPQQQHHQPPPLHHHHQQPFLHGEAFGGRPSYDRFGAADMARPALPPPPASSRAAAIESLESGALAALVAMGSKAARSAAASRDMGRAAGMAEGMAPLYYSGGRMERGLPVPPPRLPSPPALADPPGYSSWRPFRQEQQQPPPPPAHQHRALSQLDRSPRSAYDLLTWGAPLSPYQPGHPRHQLQPHHDPAASRPMLLPHPAHRVTTTASQSETTEYKDGSSGSSRSSSRYPTDAYFSPY